MKTSEYGYLKPEIVKGVINLKVYFLISMILLAILILAMTVRKAGATDSCPNQPPYIKVEGDDLTQLPDDAVDVCFKFGSAKSQGCIGGVSNVWPPVVDGKYCGLSHFSYRLGPVPTPAVEPTVTPTISATPTERPIATPTPDPTPTPTIVHRTTTPEPTPVNVLGYMGEQYIGLPSTGGK
jgi:hypothetical protein